MACCVEKQTECLQVVTIGYIKDFISGLGLKDSSGNAVAVSTAFANNEYCPTYQQLTDGTVIPTFSWGTHPKNDSDGIYINPTCKETGVAYSGSQVVNQADFQARYTTFNSSTIAASSTAITACGGNSTLSYSNVYSRTSKYMDGTTCSVTSTTTNVTTTSSDNISYSANPGYGSIAGSTYTIGKNGTISSTSRSDVVGAVTTFRGGSYSSSNTVTINQSGLTGSYSNIVSSYYVATAMTTAGTNTEVSGCGAVTYTVTFKINATGYDTKSWVDSCGTNYPGTTRDFTNGTSLTNHTVSSVTGTWTAVECPTEIQDDSTAVTYTYTGGTTSSIPIITSSTLSSTVNVTRHCDQQGECITCNCSDLMLQKVDCDICIVADVRKTEMLEKEGFTTRTEIASGTCRQDLVSTLTFTTTSSGIILESPVTVSSSGEFHLYATRLLPSTTEGCRKINITMSYSLYGENCSKSFYVEQKGLPSECPDGTEAKGHFFDLDSSTLTAPSGGGSVYVYVDTNTIYGADIDLTIPSEYNSYFVDGSIQKTSYGLTATLKPNTSPYRITIPVYASGFTECNGACEGYELITLEATEMDCGCDCFTIYHNNTPLPSSAGTYSDNTIVVFSGGTDVQFFSTNGRDCTEDLGPYGTPSGITAYTVSLDDTSGWAVIQKVAAGILLLHVESNTTGANRYNKIRLVVSLGRLTSNTLFCTGNGATSPSGTVEILFDIVQFA